MVHFDRPATHGQSLQDWECIVVDDGSVDQTASVADRFVAMDSRFTLVRQSYGGVARARNRGFLESMPTTAYVSFIDAGDMWEPTAALELIAYLSKDKTAVGAHGIAVELDKKTAGFEAQLSASVGRPRLEYRGGVLEELSPFESTSFATLVCSNIISPSGVLVARRSAYENTGLYDSNLRGHGQWELTLRLSCLGPIRYLDRCVLKSRCGGRNDSENEGWRITFRRVRANIFLPSKALMKQRVTLNHDWRALQWLKIKEIWEEITAGYVKSVPQGMQKGSALLAHLIDYLAGHPLSG